MGLIHAAAALILSSVQKGGVKCQFCTKSGGKGPFLHKMGNGRGGGCGIILFYYFNQCLHFPPVQSFECAMEEVAFFVGVAGYRCYTFTIYYFAVFVSVAAVNFNAVIYSARPVFILGHGVRVK